MEIPVSLNHIQEFETILENYHVSGHALDVLSHTKLVVLVGLTGSGRNTLINLLAKNYDYHYLVSDTTRPPKMRDGVMEENGVQYFFRTEEEILQDLKMGEFLEAEIIHGQQVSGISIRELIRAGETNKVVVDEIEMGGAENIARVKPDTICIFVIPPSFEVWQDRFIKREHISETEYRNRIITSQRNIRLALSKPYYHFVLNDDLNTSAEVINSIVHTGQDLPERQAFARKTAEEILARIDKAQGA